MNTPIARGYAVVLLIAATILASACATQQAPVEPPVEENSLIALISAGKTEEVKKRFSSSESINQKNAQGQSLLHIAALRDDAEMVSFLLALGADMEITDAGGETPLAAAVKASCLNAAASLSAKGARVFSAGSAGTNIFEVARTSGEAALAAIITGDTSRQKNAEGKTMLHLAAEQLDQQAVQLLLDRGSVVSELDNKGMSPLSYVYASPENQKSASIAAMLLLAGAEPVRGAFSYFEIAVIKRNFSMRFDEGKTPLHFASENGHGGYVSYILDKKVPVNAKDIASSTPLHGAVRNGSLDIVRLLLASGADPDQRDSSGNTPLHLVMPIAVRSQIFGHLLEAGANPNLKDNYGETPLHIAARLGMSEDIIRSLLASGADLNERNKKGVTPLALAIERNQTSQANLFVKLGADIHAEDIDGHTALSRAILAGIELVRAVIIEENTQSRDSRGRTPLHIAVLMRADTPVINYLISVKADVNARDKNGDTPLHIAIRNNDRAAGEILLAYRADVFSTNVSGDSPLKIALTLAGGRQDWTLNSNVIKSSDGSGNTPLHLAAEWQLAPVILFIAEKGGDMNARNANGETPLFNAVKSDSGATIRIMLSETNERRPDINARDFLGNTVLHACIRWSSTNAAETLLAWDASGNARRLVNARNLAGKTALHEAARRGDSAFIRMLLNAGADINAADETGKTALSDSIILNKLDSVRLLLERGASPVMQDMYGRNAYHEAVEYSDVSIIQLIRSAGGNPMARDSFGRTPLSLAFKKSAEAVMAVTGGNTNIVDSDGNTPLHIAVSEHSNESTLQGLIRERFPVNNRNRTGSTALLMAIRAGQEASTRILLAAGADPFASDNQGESPVSVALKAENRFVSLLGEFAADKTDTIGDGVLHYAARMGSADTVKKLLALPRIDRSAKNIAGETARDIALRWQRPEIAELLK